MSNTRADFSRNLELIQRTIFLRVNIFFFNQKNHNVPPKGITSCHQYCGASSQCPAQRLTSHCLLWNRPAFHAGCRGQDYEEAYLCLGYGFLGRKSCRSVAPCVEDRRSVWAAYHLILGTDFPLNIAAVGGIPVRWFSVLFGEVYPCYRPQEERCYSSLLLRLFSGYECMYKSFSLGHICPGLSTNRSEFFYEVWDCFRIRWGVTTKL